MKALTPTKLHRPEWIKSFESTPTKKEWALFHASVMICNLCSSFDLHVAFRVKKMLCAGFRAPCAADLFSYSLVMITLWGHPLKQSIVSFCADYGLNRSNFFLFLISMPIIIFLIFQKPLNSSSGFRRNETLCSRSIVFIWPKSVSLSLSYSK